MNERRCEINVRRSNADAWRTACPLEVSVWLRGTNIDIACSEHA